MSASMAGCTDPARLGMRCGRLDATRPSLGEMSTLAQVTEMLGAALWRNAMIVLTHAHAARSVSDGRQQHAHSAGPEVGPLVTQHFACSGPLCCVGRCHCMIFCLITIG